LQSFGYECFLLNIHYTLFFGTKQKESKLQKIEAIEYSPTYKKEKEKRKKKILEDERFEP